MENKEAKQYRWLGIILLVVFILFLLGFYWFMNKEAQFSSESTSGGDTQDKMRSLCLEEQQKCLEGVQCDLTMCAEPVTASDVKRKSAKKGTSGGSGTNEPSNPNPTPSPSPTEEPIQPYMDSENYKIAWDSINSGGGYATSENYIGEDTVGEIATGYSSSENYLNHAGYQQNDQEEIYISLAVDYASVVLTTGGNGVGDFLDGITGGIVTGYHTWTTTTNSSTGYTLALKQTAGAKSGGGTDGALTNTGDTSYEFLPIIATVPAVWPSLSAGETGFGYSLSNLTGDANPASDWSGKTDGTYFVKVGTSDYDLLDSSAASDPGGDGARINWKAEFKTGGGQYLLPGTYKEFVTVTAATQ